MRNARSLVSCKFRSGANSICTYILYMIFVNTQVHACIGLHIVLAYFEWSTCGAQRAERCEMSILYLLLVFLAGGLGENQCHQPNDLDQVESA